MTPNRRPHPQNPAAHEGRPRPLIRLASILMAGGLLAACGSDSSQAVAATATTVGSSVAADEPVSVPTTARSAPATTEAPPATAAPTTVAPATVAPSTTAPPATAAPTTTDRRAHDEHSPDNCRPDPDIDGASYDGGADEHDHIDAGHNHFGTDNDDQYPLDDGPGHHGRARRV